MNENEEETTTTRLGERGQLAWHSSAQHSIAVVVAARHQSHEYKQMSKAKMIFLWLFGYLLTLTTLLPTM